LRLRAEAAEANVTEGEIAERALRDGALQALIAQIHG